MYLKNIHSVPLSPKVLLCLASGFKDPSYQVNQLACQWPCWISPHLVHGGWVVLAKRAQPPVVRHKRPPWVFNSKQWCACRLFTHLFTDKLQFIRYFQSTQSAKSQTTDVTSQTIFLLPWALFRWETRMCTLKRVLKGLGDNLQVSTSAIPLPTPLTKWNGKAQEGKLKTGNTDICHPHPCRELNELVTPTKAGDDFRIILLIVW